LIAFNRVRVQQPIFDSHMLRNQQNLTSSP
jgi:hypothetical protein